MKADLHCHTVFSDGSVTPEELICLAKEQNLQSIAITDHDTVKGVPEAIKAGKKFGVVVLPGIETSTLDPVTGRKAHVLGYNISDTSELQSICETTCSNRRNAGEKMLLKVKKIYPIPAEMVYRRAQGCASLFKQHIMQTLMDCGYADEMFGEVFQTLFNPKNGKAYCKVEYPSPDHAAEVIRRAGGKAVLAHPGEYKSYSLLCRLASEQKIDGVEAFHPRNDTKDIPDYIKIAEKYNLAVTGGTDFHGAYTRVSRPLGSFTTNYSQLKKLFPQIFIEK